VAEDDHEIPTTALDMVAAEAGWLPLMGVHVNGSVVAISPSRSIWVFAVVAFVVSAAFLLLPVGPILRVFGYPLLAGAIAAVIFVPRMARILGTEMRIDRELQAVSIMRHCSIKTIPFDRVITFQLLQKGAQSHAGQLNLIYRDDDGSVNRTCLMCHCIQYYVTRAARKLAAESPWAVLDDHNRRLCQGAGNQIST